MILQLVTAFIGSVGFALLFGMRLKYILPAALGGLCSWAIYLLGLAAGFSIFLACLLAASFSALYSVIMARVMHAPSTLFFIIAALPLIPGSALYYMMSALVRGDFREAADYGNQTLLYTLAIAGGLCIVSTVVSSVRRYTEKHRKPDKF